MNECFGLLRFFSRALRITMVNFSLNVLANHGCSFSFVAKKIGPDVVDNVHTKTRMYIGSGFYASLASFSCALYKYLVVGQ